MGAGGILTFLFYSWRRGGGGRGVVGGYKMEWYFTFPFSRCGELLTSLFDVDTFLKLFCI